jgi:rod shape-determining protein MreC
MDTNREDISIAIRSAFLSKGTKQRFSLLALIILSTVLIFIEKIETKPLYYVRLLVNDTIYKGSSFASLPYKSINSLAQKTKKHLNLYDNYSELQIENSELKSSILKNNFLELENTQLKKLIDEQVSSKSNFASARVMLDKQSPYINSFAINVGSNKKIKNGKAVLSGKNFVGKIVDVNYFTSRVLLVTDLNSRIAIITEPSANHAILSGHGEKKPTLEYLPKDHSIKDGDKVYTSGKEGVFSPGIPIGSVKVEKDIIKVLLFSDLNQITFVNVEIGDAIRVK